MKHKLAPRACVAVVCLLGTALATSAHAQSPFEHAGFSGNHGTYSPLPGEHVDPASGTLMITATDLVLPGNAGLDLRVQRVYNSGVFPDYDQGSTAIEEDSWAGIGWRLHFGRVLQPNSLTPGATQIEMGDGSRHALHTTPSRPEGWMTSDFWVYDRSTHTLKLPNGVLYTFGHETYLNDRLGTVRYVTEIRDVWSNRITFSYFPDPGPRDGVAEIRQYLGASQVRVVTFTYDAALKSLATMQYLDRTWTYAQVASGPAGHSVLQTVTPPIGRPWQYQYTSPLPGELTVAIAPAGGRTDYTYADKARKAGPVSIAARVVTGRSTSGFQITPGTWTFTYGAGVNEDTTIVACPCGTTTYRFHGTGIAGDFSAWSAGSLAEQTIEQNGTVLERQTFTWLRSEAISPDPVAGSGGIWGDSATYKPLLQQHTTVRGTQSWTTTLEYHGPSFNDYGRPYKVTETGDRTRTTTRTFQGGFVPYILPQVATEIVKVGIQEVTSTWTYDLNTGFVTGRSGLGGPMTYEPSTQGNVAAAIDALGRRTDYVYSWGALSNTTTATVNAWSDINEDGTVYRSHIGPAGSYLTTTYAYTKGRLTSVQPPGSANAVGYEYDNSWGEWIKVTRGLAQTQHHLDGFGRVRATSNTQNLNAYVSRDACGRVTFESLPYTAAGWEKGVATEYDALGRITKVTDPAGKSTTFVHAGIDATRFDPLNRQTVFDYAAFGTPASANLIGVRDATQQATWYTYDVTGQLDSADVPGTTLKRQWLRDARGLVFREIQPESGTTEYVHNAAGNLTQTTDADGIVTVRGYDLDGRLNLVDYPGSADDVTMTYDAFGRVASQSVPGRSIAYTYEPATGRLASRRDVGDGLNVLSTYAYDGNDNLTGITYPSGRVVTYDYDAENRLVSVKQNGAIFADLFAYDDRGRLTSYRTGTITHAVTYDDAQRVNRLTSGSALDLTYGYDDVGNVRQIKYAPTEAPPREAFTVDNLDRLVTADGPWGALSWTYDPAGNRISETAGAITQYQYDVATQRLTSTSGAFAETFTYLPSGRLQTDSRGVYTYTPAGLLKTATAAAVTASYAHDAAGLRFSRTVNGQTTYTIRSAGGDILSEYAAPCGAAVWAKDTIYAAGRPLGAVKATTQQPSVALTAATTSAGESAGTASVSLTLTVPGGVALACPLTVSVQTAPGTALGASDFTTTDRVVTFAAGSANGSAQMVAVPILTDTRDEDDETFFVDLVGVTGGLVGTTARTTVTITDDDPVPSLTVANVSIGEGAAGTTTTATFGVTLSAASGRAVQFTYATVDGSARDGHDYTARSGTITVPAGSTTASIAVPVLGDRRCEVNELFTVALSAPVNVTLATTTATATIVNDDVTCRTWGDFFTPLDGAADAALFNPSTRLWKFRDSNGGVTTGTFGAFGDTLIYGDIFVPADYDGDGKTDYAVYRPAPHGHWYIWPANGSPWYVVWWVTPQAGDIPAPGDFDGDGKIDQAFYRPSDGLWRIYPSGSQVAYVVDWGIPGATVQPAAADYDGDGKTDVAFYYPASGYWYVVSSQTGVGQYLNWGVPGSTLVTAAPADYDGDGKADLAFYNGVDYFWYLVPSTTQSAVYISWGNGASNIPVPADYDGDGKSDVAFYEPSARAFSIIRSSSGQALYVYMASDSEAGSIPVLRRPR